MAALINELEAHHVYLPANPDACITKFFWCVWVELRVPWPRTGGYQALVDLIHK